MQCGAGRLLQRRMIAGGVVGNAGRRAPMARCTTGAKEETA
jgi:hypothetical protein